MHSTLVVFRINANKYIYLYRQGLLTMSQSSVKPPLPVVAGAINIPNSPLVHHNYTWAQQSSVC